MTRALRFGLVVFAACSVPPQTPTPGPTGPTAAFDGEICTGAPGARLKLLVALEANQSLQVTDPNGTRFTALESLLSSLPQDPTVEVVVMLFSGSTVTFVTGNQVPEFTPVSKLTPADRQLLLARILNFVAPGNSNATDFVTPLNTIRALIAHDLAEEHLAHPEELSRYEVIFLSDGHPTEDQDAALLCGDIVRGIAALDTFAAAIRVNTVHVFAPSMPISATACDPLQPFAFDPSGCRLPAWPPGTCPQRLVDTDAERLARMAELGGGEFRSFRGNAPVDFGFVVHGAARSFSLETVVATNFTLQPRGGVDSDSDGVTDDVELQDGTSPALRDTDNDGYTDGVQRYARMQGLALPLCPREDIGVDSDCDGLLDCDEEALRSNPIFPDSDEDGIPDGVEWQLGLRPSTRDGLLDADADGVPNGEEARSHSDPNDPASAEPTYRYSVGSTRRDLADSWCYQVRVEGIRLAESKVNDLYLAFSARSDANPLARPLVRQLRVSTVLPADRVARFVPQDFRRGCIP